MFKRAPQTIIRKSVQPNRLSLHRRFVAKVQNVPSMGDSITEGTVVEWSKKEPTLLQRLRSSYLSIVNRMRYAWSGEPIPHAQSVVTNTPDDSSNSIEVGEAVKVDDIVVLIETDKILVEVRAEEAGVITQQHAEIEGTVEVGAKLYTLDTDGTASVSSEPVQSQPAAAPPKQETAPPPKPASAPAKPAPIATAAPIGRTPMIQFRHGKRAPPKPATAGSSISPDFLGPDAFFSVELPSRFQRKAFSEEEIEATLSGGAWLVDKGVTQTISKRLDL